MDGWTIGLSSRAINCLKAEDYENKDQVRKAIRDGALYHSTRKSGYIPNYGKRTHEEVVRWVKIYSREEVEDMYKLESASLGNLLNMKGEMVHARAFGNRDGAIRIAKEMKGALDEFIKISEAYSLARLAISE